MQTTPRIEAGDQVARGELVAGADRLPERQRQQDERVEPGLREDDRDGRDALGQVLDDELEGGVAEAGEQARRHAPRRELDALAEQ